MKVIIIGGGACGASAAARIRRLDEKAEVVILEKTNEISIANCGLPYYTSGVINDREKMLVSSPEKFKSWFNIDVRLNSEVIGIDVESKNVILKNGEKLSYDKLVLAQGANPILPDFEGMPKDRVFTVRTLYDADRIKDFIRNNNIQKAVVIGGGFIGIEMAENLAEMGLKTTLIEAQNQILAPVDYEAAAFVQNEMRDNGVELILSDAVKEFAGNKIVLNSQKEVEFDMPNFKMALAQVIIGAADILMASLVLYFSLIAFATFESSNAGIVSLKATYIEITAESTAYIIKNNIISDFNLLYKL